MQCSALGIFARPSPRLWPPCWVGRPRGAPLRILCGPGSAAHHFALLHAGLRPGHVTAIPSNGAVNLRIRADMHNRMKEALVLLGRLPRAAVRPPLVKLGRAEIERIRIALVEAGMPVSDASRAAA